MTHDRRLTAAYGKRVRTLEVIDQQLRLIAAIRASIGGQPPSIAAADELLDERLLIRTAAGPTITVQ